MSVSLFTELKRRNVFKVGVAYLALGWLIIQFTSIAFIYALQGDFIQAIHWQKKTVELDNGSVGNKVALAIYYLNLREIVKANEILLIMQKQFSEHPMTMALQGLILLAQGETTGWTN